MKYLVIPFISFYLTACASITFNKDYSKLSANEHNRFQHFIFFGFINLSTPVEPEKICAEQDWISVKSEWGPISVATSILTGFLYSPVEVQIKCIKKS